MISVSYTHLDVYKRQTLYRRIFYVIGAEGGLDPDTALGQTFIGVNL